MEVKVLGSGCSKCHSTIGIIERAAQAAGVAVEIVKVQNPDEIRRAGVKATPAVMFDGQVVHSGGLPAREDVQAWLKPGPIGLLNHPTRHLFFTGKGGAGQTSLSTAAALTLADAGRTGPLVSTDAASNLDGLLGIELRNTPVAVPGAPGLSVLNIDPDNAAESYRQQVLAQMGADASAEQLSTVREQLSGACTTEIAAFDACSSLLADDAGHHDHIVFDTAPTGHTLRLLSQPKAGTGFLDGNDRGASCLGPHSGLKMQEVRFKAALDALSDPTKTTVILVTRPDKGAIAEAAHTSGELHALGLNNQRLAINGVFHASDRSDAVACAIEGLGQQALDAMPASLRVLPQDQVPLRAFDTVGLPALRALLGSGAGPIAAPSTPVVEAGQGLPGLDALADALAAAGHGLIMVMGKGGVGKTTVAAALALGLVQRGKTVHLSTTDPAAHLAGTLDGDVPGLHVSRIDPKVETQRYIDRIMAAKSPKLDAAEQALLLEGLQSPCTEEVAVFHAFSRIVSEARSAFLVLDTAPTGHSMLSMDATGADHRQMTPVSQAAALQDDLRRACIEPYARVLNKSVLAAGTRDPLLAARLAGERKQMARMASGLAKNIHALPWLAVPPVGFAELSRLVSGAAPAAAVAG